MRNFKVFVMVLLVVFTLGLVGCSSGGSNVTDNNTDKGSGEKQAAESSKDKKVYELKLGSKMVENHLESQAVKRFIELVDEKSDGQIKITSYFGETLGNSKVQLENVMNGVQDFYVESYTFFANYVPEFRVHSLPWLFGSNENYQKFLKSPIEEEMEQKLIEQNGLRIINEDKNWLRGPYRILVSRRPIQSMEDLKGLKLRQPDNQPTIKTWSALGANPSIIPYSETYLAVQQGMVDAVTVPIANLYSDKFIELIKNVTVTHEYQQQVAIAMNEEVYKSLPEDLQKVIIESANEAGDYCTQLVNEEGNTLRQKLIDEYEAKFYDVDLTPFKGKAKEIHMELEASGFIPTGLIDHINEYLDNN